MFYCATRILSQCRILLGIVILTVLAALMGCWLSTGETHYQYRGLARWQGVFENPNTCGQAAAGGLLLAIGCLAGGMTGTALWMAVRVALSVSAIAALAVPLVFTFSRGAWLGCALGLVYLGSQGWSWWSQRLGGGVGGFIRRNLVPLAIAVALLGVTAFWLFRFTEFKPVRRAFSVGNINDSSWRMRVEAWEGALNIMAHSPWVGSEWKKPELTYYQLFQKPKVLEGAAIQLNDYFIVGMTWGIPVLVGFAAWVWSAFRPRRSDLVESGGEHIRTGCRSVRPRAELQDVHTNQAMPGWEAPMQTAGAQSATPGAGVLPDPTAQAGSLRYVGGQDEWLKTTCRAAVVVLLVGFWFDGGLFKWALAVPFWLLLEMGRSHPLWERHRVRG
jgi:hypothetical protein